MDGPSPSETNILVVDDNAGTRHLLSQLFKDVGIKVKVAESVAQACQILDQCEWKFDLVLSDISMPGETGFDLLKRIKQHDSPNPELPVILTTAQLPEAEHRILGLQLGAVDYIVRPIELKELVLRVQHAIEHFQRIRTLQDYLERSEGQAAVGRILAAHSHEMRNIASVMAMGARMLGKLLTNEAQSNQQIQETLKSLTRSSDMIVEINRLGKVLMDGKAAPLTDCDLRGLVSETLSIIGPKLKGFLIRDEISAINTVAYSRCQEFFVKQILVNFILNAIDSITDQAPLEGGCIRLTLSQDKTGKFWQVEVSDNGIGLPNASVRREFEAFDSTKKLRGGQGLGLWYSNRMAQMMGGTISLSSEGAGLGATSTLTVQKIAAPAPSADDDLSRYFIPDSEL
jgi:signal transduction histidine kinase